MRRRFTNNAPSSSTASSAKVVRTLPCLLTETEVDDRARQCSATFQDYKLVEAQKKDLTAKLTGKMKALREEGDRLTEIVTTGLEKRPVDCYWRFRRAQGLAELIRTDTLDVVELTGYDGEGTPDRDEPDRAPVETGEDDAEGREE